MAKKKTQRKREPGIVRWVTPSLCAPRSFVYISKTRNSKARAVHRRCFVAEMVAPAKLPLVGEHKKFRFMAVPVDE